MLIPSRVKMYKSKITLWGFDKKLKEHEVMSVVRRKRERNALGKASAFRIRGQPLDQGKVAENLKRKRMTEDDVSSGRASPALSTMSGISCFTPPGSALLGAAGEIQAMEYDGVINDLDRIVNPTLSRAATQTHTYEGMEHYPSEPWDSDAGDVIHSRSAREGAAIHSRQLISSTAVPQTMSPPTSIKISEHIFSHIQSYIIGSFAAKTWSLTGRAEDLSDVVNNKLSVLRRLNFQVGWPNLVVDACDLLKHGKVAKAGDFLRQAFIQVEYAIKDEDPAFMANLLWALDEIGVLRKRTDIAIMLLKQIYRMACLTVGYDHPISSISSHFLSLDIWDGISEVAHRVVYDAHELALGSSHKTVVMLRQGVIHCFVRRNDWTAAESRYRDCVQEEEFKGVRNSFLLQRSLFHLAYVLLNQGKLAEAENTARRSARWTISEDGLDRIAGLRRQVRSLALMSRAQQGQGEFGLAEESLREACDVAIANFGPSDAETMYMVSKLEELLRCLGRDQELMLEAIGV